MVAAVLMLALLLVGHAIADTVLQPAWLSRDKRHSDWQVRWSALGLHGSVHGFMVLLVTGQPLLCLAEMILHPLIDMLKALGFYGMKTDQVLHVACKVAWVVVALGLTGGA